MDIETLIELINLKKDLADTKSEEMSLRKEIMGDITDGYEGKKKTFHWGGNYETEFGIPLHYDVDVSCNLSLSLDKDLFHEYIHEGKLANMTAEEKDCLKMVPTLVVPSLKHIPDDSILYELIDSKPALPSIRIKKTKITGDSYE